LAFWHKITNRFSKPKKDTDDVEESVINAIIEVCYAYDTTSYINSLEEAWPDNLTVDDKKALDPVLSCLSLGIAIRYLRNRYDSRSKYLINKILDRLHSAALSVTDSAEGVANFYVELVSNYSNVLDYDAAGVLDYGMGVCENVFQPVEDLFEQLQPSPSVALFINAFIAEFGKKIGGLIETAEDKYDYIPCDR